MGLAPSVRGAGEACETKAGPIHRIERIAHTSADHYRRRRYCNPSHCHKEHSKKARKGGN